MAKNFTAITWSEDSEKKLYEALKHFQRAFPNINVDSVPDKNLWQIMLTAHDVPEEQIPLLKNSLANILRTNSFEETFATFESPIDKERADNIEMLNAYHREPMSDLSQVRQAAQAMSKFEYHYNEQQTKEMAKLGLTAMLSPAAMLGAAFQGMNQYRDIKLHAGQLHHDSFHAIRDKLNPLGYEVKYENGYGNDVSITKDNVSQGEWLKCQHAIVDILNNNRDDAVFTVSNDGVIDKNGILSRHGFMNVDDVLFENIAMQHAEAKERFHLVIEEAVRQSSNYQNSPLCDPDPVIPESRKVGALPLWNRDGNEIFASDEFTKILNKIDDVKVRESLLLETMPNDLLRVRKAVQAAMQGNEASVLSIEAGALPAKYHDLKFHIGDHEFVTQHAELRDHTVAQRLETDPVTATLLKDALLKDHDEAAPYAQAIHDRANRITEDYNNQYQEEIASAGHDVLKNS